MTDPFGPELPRPAIVASLDEQLVALGSLPELLVEPVAGRHGQRNSRGEIVNAVGIRCCRGHLRQPFLSSEDQIANRLNHGTGAHHRHLDVRDLVGRLAADLSYRLDDQFQPVHIALGEVTATGIER